LWKGGLFPAKFISGSRQFSFLLGREGSYKSVLVAVLTKRLNSISHIKNGRYLSVWRKNLVGFRFSTILRHLPSKLLWQWGQNFTQLLENPNFNIMELFESPPNIN
jgi:hypothetical protein